MTQPPYGDQPPPYGQQPPPPYGEELQPTYGQPPHYPHQELLPQLVQPRRSRLPQIIGAVIVVVAVVAALVVWRVVHDNGEDNRAAYCSALKKLTSGDGLGGLADDVGSGGGTVPKPISDLVAIAPASVSDEWQDLVRLVRAGPSASTDVVTIARAFTDLRTIVADANSACGMDLQFPG